MAKKEAELFITWEDDGESFTATYKGKTITSMNHDEHGWEGMYGFITALTKFFQAAGIPVLTNSHAVD